MRDRPGRRGRVIDAVESLLRGNDEELEASRTFDELATLRIEDWSAFLTARPHRRTESLVARLTAEGRRAAKESPERALAMFAVAEGVANDLRDPFLIARCRGYLAKERAHALRVLRRYAEALEAVDSAEAFLSHVYEAAYELAFVRWARAMIFFETNRCDKALRLAVTVARTFEKCDDFEYANHVRILVADACDALGETGDAISMYLELLKYFEDLGDEDIVPMLRSKLAVCGAKVVDT
jgi:tetratricopeptide (TPR) repeat protein